MATNKPMRTRIRELKEEYSRLKSGKDSLLTALDELELPEAVYNSNAIENSSLTLRETETILLDDGVRRDVTARELFEAKNLARVSDRVRALASSEEVTLEVLLSLHKTLLGGINDSVAGRFRTAGERVRVGLHIAPGPEQIERMLGNALMEYENDHESYDLDKIARFHLEFEFIHPFVDGNGRMGRVLMNWQLKRHGFPPIIIRDKEKKAYYATFREYESRHKADPMAKILTIAVLESLHKRVAYLKDAKIVTLASYAKTKGESLHSLINRARRQTIPAFRERGVWKIAKE